MAPIHQDPLVYNALTGKWQNASKAGPSGEPVGVTIGSPTGSQVSMQPSVGQSLQLDGGRVGIIESAFQMNSAAASEQVPGYNASVVFNHGQPNEQVGHLMVSGMANGTAQATLMTSVSADGTIPGATYSGTMAPGTPPVTWSMTTSLATNPASKTIQVAPGYQLVGSTPGTTGTSTPDGWHQLSLKNGFSPQSGAGIVGGVWHRVTALGDLGEIYGDIVSPGSQGNIVCASMPSEYAPATAQNAQASWNVGPPSWNPGTMSDSTTLLELIHGCNNRFGNISSIFSHLEPCVWIYLKTSGDIEVVGLHMSGIEIMFHIFYPLHAIA